MVFSSNLFLLSFLPLFLLTYYVASYRFKNTILLIASIVFYAWGAPKFIFFLFFSLFIDFYLVKGIQLNVGKTKKHLMWISITFNILLLGYFKYANFFVENINSLVSLWGANGIANWENVLLPIGISFITFHKITYTIDAYRNVHKPLEKFSDYALYIIMFPHQIAGPIVRFSEIADDIIDRRKKINVDKRVEGMFRFIVGLSKKVLIANPLSVVADNVFSLQITDISTYASWLGILAYTFQIYFDFSGYSDMGIGLGKMLGFDFPENFNAPYISKNITDFWRRWHMTLGRFMRDYLYIPLGGNKVSKYRMYLNLWLVFLISGLWHGASWTFVIWGAYHGVLLIMDRLFLIKLYEGIMKYIAIPITFLFVVIGWVFFRSADVHYAFGYIGQMFSFSSNKFTLLETTSHFWFIFFLAIFIVLFSFLKEKITFQKRVSVENITFVLKSIALLVILLICIADINSSGFNPFIYFRF